MQEPTWGLSFSVAVGLGLAASIMLGSATVHLLTYSAALSLWGVGLGF
jgi:hypothetical protein